VHAAATARGKVASSSVDSVRSVCKLADETEILKRLPSHLMHLVINQRYRDVILSSALFYKLDATRFHGEIKHADEVLVEISLQLEYTVSNPGLPVVQEGQYAEQMYLPCVTAGGLLLLLKESARFPLTVYRSLDGNAGQVHGRRW
jgi:hypothetical protein